MGLFRFLFKWSLQITGSAIVGYNYVLKPEQQADLYGMYRSALNSYRAGKQIYAVTNQYKRLLEIKQNPQQYKKQLSKVNTIAAKRLQELCRTNQGVYMRLGQYLGHLKYAYPQQFSNILKQLYERPNYQVEDYKYLKVHIQRQIGKKTKQIFQTLKTAPIKSDLFYQVYKGQLAQNFLDINMKVVHPYAKTQAKYDFVFLQKAIEYINQFKQKNFKNQYPLMLNLLCSNLKNQVQKELNLKTQQQQISQIKVKTSQLVQQMKKKNVVLPIYIPHIYSQYTRQNVMIQEYFEGQHLSDTDALLKQNYNLKSVSNSFIELWNSLLQKHQLLMESYSPTDIILRKSRPTEQGPYQLSLLNFSQISTLPSFYTSNYPTLWKQFIVNKKLNPKKPQERVNFIRNFYSNLPSLYFSLFLNDQNSLSQLAQKINISVDSQKLRSQLINYSKGQLQKQIVKKVQQKKILPVYKSKVKVQEELQKKYDFLKRAFQIQYQPWKLSTLYKAYKEAFRQQKHFGVV